MGKAQNDLMLDAALDYIKNNADLMILCSAQPTSYAEATATYALADVAMASGDFTHANGDTSGRKTTVAAKSSVTVDANGTGNHIALVKTGTSTLLYVNTPAVNKAVLTGDLVNFAAWKIEIADPS